MNTQFKIIRDFIWEDFESQYENDEYVKELIEDFGSLGNAILSEGNLLTDEGVYKHASLDIQNTLKNSKIIVVDLPYSFSYVERILYFQDIDLYIKLSGWYNSYEGYELFDITEVRPKEKTITVYE